MEIFFFPVGEQQLPTGATGATGESSDVDAEPVVHQ